MTRINAGIPNQLTNNKNKVMKYYTYNPISGFILDGYDSEQDALEAAKQSSVIVVHVYDGHRHVATIS